MSLHLFLDNYMKQSKTTISESQIVKKYAIYCHLYDYYDNREIKGISKGLSRVFISHKHFFRDNEYECLFKKKNTRDHNFIRNHIVYHGHNYIEDIVIDNLHFDFVFLRRGVYYFIKIYDLSIPIDTNNKYIFDTFVILKNGWLLNIAKSKLDLYPHAYNELISISNTKPILNLL